MRLHCRSPGGCHACIAFSSFHSSDRSEHDHHIFYGDFCMPGMECVSWGAIVSLGLWTLILGIWYEICVRVARFSGVAVDARWRDCRFVPVRH